MVVISFFGLGTIEAQITSFKENTVGVTFKMESEILRINVYDDDIIQIKYCADTVLPEKNSLVVIREWELSDFSVAENDTTVVVNTSDLKIIVNKITALVSFYTTGDELILSEDSRSVTETIVSDVNTYKCVATFNSPADEALYGLGQHQQSIMNYKGRIQWLDQHNTEVALPIIVSNRGYGIMWDNYAKTLFNANLNSNTQYKFDSEAGDMVDYYFFYGPDIDSVISAYRRTTGTAPMFPKWAYGLFQSMDKYQNDEELYRVSGMYRKKGIPLDVIVQDWDYWNPYPWGSHRMNETRYPDPEAMIDSLHENNIHTMISIWPIHSEGDDYFNEFEAIGANYPSSGTRHYYDPHNEEARDIYWRQLHESLFANYGWDAWWSDGCEPDNWPDSFDRKSYMTALGPGSIYYNTYPLMHTSAVSDNWRNDIEGKRLFTLARSAFLGQQRNSAAVWSGDIQSNWIDFRKQLSAGLNFSLSGMPYWTTDIGGYWGTDWTTTSNRELFIRWFQYGTFCPMFRIHGKLERTLYSDFAWDANTRNILLNYDKLRYRLMPYIYSLARKVTSENYTVMRHLIFDYRTDVNVNNIDDQFMFGPFMMINPVASEGITSRDVYLPAGQWYDFWTGELIEGAQTINTSAPLDRIPIFIKAGSIIPMGPEIQYAMESVDPLEIRVYKGSDGSFNLYEDEGDSYNYETGQYSIIPLGYNESTTRLTIGSRQGNYTGMPENRTFKIIWVDEGYGTGINYPVTYDTIVSYNGSEVIVQLNSERIVPATHYEAEEAFLSGGAIVSSDNSGFSGMGYITGNESSEEAVTDFTVNVPEMKSYLVKLRYSAANDNANRDLELYVNNVNIALLECNATAGWHKWGEVSYLVYLDEGENSIQYIADSASVNLDCIDIFAPSDPSTLNIGEKKITRLKLQNTNLCLEENEGNLSLEEKNVDSENQFWTIESIDMDKFRISSFINGQFLTVRDSLLADSAEVILGDYNSGDNQQWIIDAFGFGICRFTASHSLKCMSLSTEDTIMQLDDTGVPSQRWVMEDIAEKGNGNGLLGEYYEGNNFSNLVFRRTDEEINFNWGLNRPIELLSENHFSVRWTGEIQPQYPEVYTFYATSDDGVKLWINDSLIINDWTARAVKELSGEIELQANELFDFKFEYFDNEYDAVVVLEWESNSHEREVIPKSQLYSDPDYEQPVGVINSYEHKDEFIVFPNPASDLVYIQITSEQSGSAMLSISDLSGRLIFNTSLFVIAGQNNFEVSINENGFDSGNYLIAYKSNKDIFTDKLIIR